MIFVPYTVNLYKITVYMHEKKKKKKRKIEKRAVGFS